ncbi:hypothetical protein PoB_006103000 [Plakobranchus ocellatus]|uniref:Uncharacterized protein n=1 Tax=Plakobranchus ocellatus TaxID=259542 RepID=A0AAV4CRS0_9GAST|nr:hypothetical protein PoB_006103000 [Plakobranchus ocellatus]
MFCVCDKQLKWHLLPLCELGTFYKLSDSSVYNQPNCGTKVMATLTLLVNFDLDNKRLACLSYNKTYIEGFDITDISELFNVSVPENEKAPELQFSVKVVLWITAALIIFVLAQQGADYICSRIEEEGKHHVQRYRHSPTTSCLLG